MAKKNDKKPESTEKVELAKTIAKQRKRVVKTYESIENSLLRVIRWASSWVDRLLFNQRYAKFIAIILAVLLYVTISLGGNVLNTQRVQQAMQLGSVPVAVEVNDTLYEVVGIPKTVDVTILGEASDLQMVHNQGSYKVVADLSGYGEGTHSVKLSAVDFSQRVTVQIDPSTVTVEIRKKVSQTFPISYDYVNVNKMDTMYVAGIPTLSVEEVIARGSTQTIDSIANIKALIDVSGKTGSFEGEATLVAYNSQGEKIDVDLMPAIVQVSVPINSPHKTVPVVVVPVGEIPNGKSIDTITLDHASVDIYGSESILAKYEEIKVNIDATKLTEDSKFSETITVPSGIRKISVSKVNMEIKLKDTVSLVIEDVPITFENNVNGYLFSADTPTTIDVTVYGTTDNIRSINKENIGTVYIDMASIAPGEQEIPISFKGGNPYVTYVLESETVNATVLEQQ
ncbi:MAG: hypothetical protein LBR25_07715 [Erysipelotrichaceae bacterium]|jgi:YbbR domain-containing protein|nr:hypothetical protein [Erysipelotrichaceae bacterium]